MLRLAENIKSGTADMSIILATAMERDISKINKPVSGGDDMTLVMSSAHMICDANSNSARTAITVGIKMSNNNWTAVRKNATILCDWSVCWCIENGASGILLEWVIQFAFSCAQKMCSYACDIIRNNDSADAVHRMTVAYM